MHLRRSQVSAPQALFHPACSSCLLPKESMHLLRAVIREALERSDLDQVVRHFNDRVLADDTVYDEDTTPDGLAFTLTTYAAWAWDDVHGSTLPDGTFLSHFLRLPREQQVDVLVSVLGHPRSCVPTADDDPDLEPLAARYGNLSWVARKSEVRKNIARMLSSAPKHDVAEA